MKKTFTFAEGQYWDGDEPIFEWIYEQLCDDPKTLGAFPKIKETKKVTVIIN
jgi:hypothetical protein